MNVAIVCCCLPVLRPLFTRLWRKTKQYGSDKTHRANNYLPNIIRLISRSAGSDKWSESKVKEKKHDNDGDVNITDRTGSSGGASGKPSRKGDDNASSPPNTPPPTVPAPSFSSSLSRSFSSRLLLPNSATNATTNTAGAAAAGATAAIGRDKNKTPYPCANNSRNYGGKSSASTSWLSISQTINEGEDGDGDEDEDEDTDHDVELGRINGRDDREESEEDRFGSSRSIFLPRVPDPSHRSRYHAA